MAQARTLFDKIWDQHVVRSVGESVDLLHVDRHLLHDLSGARALSEVREKGHQVHSPQLALSTPDHTLSTAAGRDENSTENSRRLAALLLPWRDELTLWREKRLLLLFCSFSLELRQ